MINPLQDLYLTVQHNSNVPSGVQTHSPCSRKENTKRATDYRATGTGNQCN